jgi:3-deoxy-D-arabino-heptulosonate 7-phosphate (DAHP) synthase class II
MWTKNSYKLFKRYLDYFDPSDKVFDKIAQLPGIVSHNKIENLKKELKECEEHKRVLIHCGDCA